MTGMERRGRQTVFDRGVRGQRHLFPRICAIMVLLSSPSDARHR